MNIVQSFQYEGYQRFIHCVFPFAPDTLICTENRFTITFNNKLDITQIQQNQDAQKFVLPITTRLFLKVNNNNELILTYQQQVKTSKHILLQLGHCGFVNGHIAKLSGSQYLISRIRLPFIYFKFNTPSSAQLDDENFKPQLEYLVKILGEHERLIYQVVREQSRGWIMTCSSDKVMKYIDVEEQQVVKSLNFGHQLYELEMLSNSLVAISGDSPLIRLYDNRVGRVVQQLVAKQDQVCSILYRKRTGQLVTGQRETPGIFELRMMKRVNQPQQLKLKTKIWNIKEIPQTDKIVMCGSHFVVVAQINI